MKEAVKKLTVSPPLEASISGDRSFHRIEQAEIFRCMIRAEIAGGRLTPAHRRRIVQYASQLGINPLEAGRIVSTCCRDVEEAAGLPSVPSLRYWPAIRRRWTLGRIAILVGLALVAEFILLRWSQ